MLLILDHIYCLLVVVILGRVAIDQCWGDIVFRLLIMDILKLIGQGLLAEFS